MDQRLIERFHAKYRKDESGCWIWIASCAGQGYGQIKLPGERRQIYAHRLSYLIHKGELPDGKQICHTCDNPKCVNPDHLFVGTSQDNHNDMTKKKRHTYGEKSATAKATTKDVLQMKAMIQAGVPQTKIASLFGLHQSTISKINRAERWKHLAEQ
jgi:hypothetical protein